MGILLIKVTYGICDTEELNTTTRSSYILGVGNGLCNTQLLVRSPIPKGRTKNWQFPNVDYLSMWQPAKFASKHHEEPKNRTWSTKYQNQGCIANSWRSAWPPAYAMSFETLENEHKDTHWIVYPTSSPSGTVGSRSCFCTPSGPRGHLPRLHCCCHSLGVLHLELPHNVLRVFS
jgi:hypothetical protein